MKPSEAQESKPPKVSFGTINKIVASAEHWLSPYIGQDVTIDKCLELTNELCRYVPRSLDRASVYNTLLQYCDRRITPQLVTLLSWQLGGRYEELDRGPLVAYSGPSRSEWVAVQIRQMQPVRWRDSDRGRMVHMFVHYGQPAGQILTRKVPESYLRWLAYQVGFSRRITYDDEPRHFIGMKLWFYMQTNPETGEYDIVKYATSSAMNTFNRDLIKKRMRFMVDLKEDPCPHEYSWPCLSCKEVDCIANYSRYSI